MNSTQNSLELDYIEKNTENGLRIILAVLNFKPRLQYGSYDAIRNSKLKISMLMQRIFTTSDAKLSMPTSNVTSRAFPKQSFNQLVAISSYITYNASEHKYSGTSHQILKHWRVLWQQSAEPGQHVWYWGLNANNSGTTTETTQDGFKQLSRH